MFFAAPCEGQADEKDPPNRGRCAVPGNGSSTSRQRLRAPLPNLLLRKPILLPLPALVFRTRALPTKPIRQDKRPQQEQPGTRRASEAACQAALEAGVVGEVTKSYGCRE